MFCETGCVVQAQNSLSLSLFLCATHSRSEQSLPLNGREKRRKGIGKVYFSPPPPSPPAIHQSSPKQTDRQTAVSSISQRAEMKKKTSISLLPTRVLKHSFINDWGRKQGERNIRWVCWTNNIHLSIQEARTRTPFFSSFHQIEEQHLIHIKNLIQNYFVAFAADN